MNNKTLVLVFSQLFTSMIFCINSYAQQSGNERSGFKYEIEIHTDNDYFVTHTTTDHFYTYGLKTKLRILPEKSEKAMNVFGSANAFFWEFGAGIEAYTPNENDMSGYETGRTRPFAGWLYGNVQANYTFNTSVAKFGMAMGILGPSVNAGKIQNWFHDLINYKRVEGWESQVQDQFGFNLTTTYAKNLFTNKLFDSYGSLNASMGNIHTYLQPNLNFRFGKFNTIQESISLNNSILSDADNSEFFIEAGVGVRFVGYNATLQGDLPNERDVFTVENINNAILKGTLSINYSANQWLFRIAYHYSQGEINKDDSHRFGSIAAIYRFGKR